jgi:hypothetical protein
MIICPAHLDKGRGSDSIAVNWVGMHHYAGNFENNGPDY